MCETRKKVLQSYYIKNSVQILIANSIKKWIDLVHGSTNGINQNIKSIYKSDNLIGIIYHR